MSMIMSQWQFSAQYFLVIFLFNADITYGNDDVLFITTSLDGPCPQNSSCLTLSQFATNSNLNESDISLLFLPGNHTLDRELSLTQINQLTMAKSGLDDDKVYVDCSNNTLGRFSVRKAASVSIKDLHFVGCGNNNLSQVKSLTIRHTTFKGVYNKNTVLVLMEVSSATIVRCSFLSNSLHFTHYPSNKSPLFYSTRIVQYIYFEQIGTPIGALYMSFSNVTIIGSTFNFNKANIGGALVARCSNLYLARSTFSNNRANFGGVMVTHESTINADRNTFFDNVAEANGGVMVTYYDTVTIRRTNFFNNYAVKYGGVMSAYTESSININSATFMNNKAGARGGAIDMMHSSVYIKNSTFTNNSASVAYGGVIYMFNNCTLHSNSNTFTNNSAVEGGVLAANDYLTGSVMINNSIFADNHAISTGGAITCYSVPIQINSSAFTRNSANTGGAIYASGSSSLYNRHFKISRCTFQNNSAVDGGVISTNLFTFQLLSNVFENNKGTVTAGAISCTEGILNIKASDFRSNAVSSRGGGVLFLKYCTANIADTKFNRNNGSLYAFNSDLNFSGYLNFEHFTEPLHTKNITTSQEGGAITSFESTLMFTENSIVHFSNNQASHGGAILSTGSTIIIASVTGTTIANNSANVTNGKGGGMSLQQSRLEIKGMCRIVNNHADRGGGVHLLSSIVTVHSGEDFTVMINDNRAKLGGGLYSEVNSKLYILKNEPILIPRPFDKKHVSHMILSNNKANYGGAVYVADDTSAGACAPNIECFFQVLALYQNGVISDLITEITYFEYNSASLQGSNLFGGLLDRCIPSPFAEVYIKQRTNYNGVSYLENISEIELDSISSQPVRVCFCNSDRKPDCSYQPPTIRVQKGKAFNVSLVAVDQVNHAIDANVRIYLSSLDGGLGEGQQIQSVKTICTNVTFNVFSPYQSETLNFYPDGPCGDALLSTSHVTVQFTECTCLVGFQPHSHSRSTSRCQCDCDTALSPYITQCNITTSSVLRKSTNSWIAYVNVNDTDLDKYVIYPNCPLDYCQPQSKNVTINFNVPNGADSQCAYQRTGVLCGACRKGLSISLGSSRCVPCHKHWPAISVVIVLTSAIAGILLVTALLALNITISAGMINSFIFYANVISVCSPVFFPSSKPSFPSVFVAWFNLDIGIDVCFINGLDAYTKTWLQLAFPLYIIFLVVMVIIASEYSSKFAGLIGKRDPVSTLATLILLSYAKLLSITITALSFSTLHYPERREIVWLPDGNVPYFRGKHIPLVLVAVLIIIFGLPYTILLFLWQWIINAHSWKVFKWTSNTKFNAFIVTHHIPHNSKFRFWTGLLLLVRVVLYITFSITISSNPENCPLITSFVIGGIIFFKSIFGLRVYKKSLVDVVDSLLHLNLLILSVFSQYEFIASATKQTAMAYTSTVITIILFIGAVSYHVALLIKRNKKRSEEENGDGEHLLTSVESSSTEVTHSVVELPRPNQLHLFNRLVVNRKDDDEQEIIEVREIVSSPREYQ